jgi:hypothetical protein
MVQVTHGLPLGVVEKLFVPRHLLVDMPKLCNSKVIQRLSFLLPTVHMLYTKLILLLLEDQVLCLVKHLVEAGDLFKQIPFLLK